MGKRPKRRVVLFLVEGRSDREALRLAISELYDRIDENIEVFFPVIYQESAEKGGDITTGNYTSPSGKKYWVHPGNIEEAIYESFFSDFFDVEKIMPKDIEQVIQLVDMDGAFAPKECIHYDASLPMLDSLHYEENGIACSDVEKVLRRNQQKKENLNYLSSLDKIKIKQKSVPYAIYYCSCNLDHFLHHSANLDPASKCRLADAFAGNFLGDTEGFVKEICEDPGSAQGMNYEESWDFIREGMHSLERHTNLNVLLQELVEEGE